MKTLHVDRTALLHRPGDGPTVVLLHGIGSNAESWLPLIAALPQDADILAWWAPGYGASVPVAPPQPIAEHYAIRLAGMLDALDRPRVVLVGHSLGCLVAARFAAGRPERVAGLALLSPALGYRVPYGAPLPPAQQARLDELAALGPEAFAAKRAGRLVHDQAALPAVRAAMAQVRPAGYAQAVRLLAGGDLLAEAPRLPPTLIACGEQDVVTPPDNARALHAALPGGTLHLVPGAGHALPQEKPQAVAALLAGMLAHV